MNFYVPVFDEDGQLLWNLVRSKLFTDGRFTTDRRIQALLWEGDADHPDSVIVGEERADGEDGDVVLVIHESSLFPDMVFVHTLGQFFAKEAPSALALTKGWQIVDFDDPAPAQAPARPRSAGNGRR
jgi:hypothetical protein